MSTSLRSFVTSVCQQGDKCPFLHSGKQTVPPKSEEAKKKVIAHAEAQRAEGMEKAAFRGALLSESSIRLHRIVTEQGNSEFSVSDASASMTARGMTCRNGNHEM